MNTREDTPQCVLPAWKDTPQGVLQPPPCLQAGGLALASLPQLVLATILDLLSVGDVVRLSQVDRWDA